MFERFAFCLGFFVFVVVLRVGGEYSVDLVFR